MSLALRLSVLTKEWNVFNINLVHVLLFFTFSEFNRLCLFRDATVNNPIPEGCVPHS